MHTSTRLSATDFHYWYQDQAHLIETSFAHFCPDYHILDRVGVISPHLEAGILAASHGLLALTTAFYDAHRARSADFFAYPQHFVFVGQCGNKVRTLQGLQPMEKAGLWEAWGWLDVWPDAKWITAPVTASTMLKRIFDYQINRLFWPYDLRPGRDEERLPSYAAKMLQTDLKTIFYYDLHEADVACDGNLIGVQAAQPVADIIQDSVLKLPYNPRNDDIQADSVQSSRIEWYVPVTVNDFLETMSPCFER